MKKFYTSLPDENDEYEEWWVDGPSPQDVLRKRFKVVIDVTGRNSMQLGGPQRIEDFLSGDYDPRAKNKLASLLEKKTKR